MTTTAEGVEQFLASLHARHSPINTIKAYSHDLRHFVAAVPEQLLPFRYPGDTSEPFSVRFKPYPVLVVYADARKDAAFRATGPMDTISVKSCATVAYMRQKQDNIAFRRGSQLALQANCWTGYASPERTNRLSNHKFTLL